MPLRHIVLFRVYDDVPDADVTSIVADLGTLGDLPGIEAWTVELSLDERKGRVIVEDATFTSEADLENFRVSDRHAEVAARMSTMADWLIGNYWIAAA